MKNYVSCLLFVLANVSAMTGSAECGEPSGIARPESKPREAQLPGELVLYPGRNYSEPEWGYASAMGTVWKNNGREFTSGNINTFGCVIQLPGFRYKDILGFPGGVYRVELLKPHKTRMERLEEEELPAGVQPPAEDSYVYPIGAYSPFPGGRTGIPEYPRFQIKEICRQADENLIAVIEVRTDVPRVNGGWTFRFTTQEVAVGDVFELGGKRYRVRKLIPANEKTQVVGWIEFAPDSE